MNDRDESRTAIVRLGRTLVATMQGSINDSAALALKTDLARQISETGASGVALELSTIEMVDSFIGRVISDIASISSILGARVILVGMQPAVAITMVELGLLLPNIETAIGLEEGLLALRHGKRRD